MQSFEDLPDDIVLGIISEIEYNKDVVSFALASKRIYDLCDLAQRRKYRRVRIRQRSQFDKAFEFLLSILRKPRYIAYVHHLEVDQLPLYNVKWAARPSQREVDPKDLKRLRRATQDAGFTGEYEMTVVNMLMRQDVPRSEDNDPRAKEKALTRGIHMGQAIAALLVAICYNLKTLKINTWGAGPLSPQPGQNLPNPSPLLKFPLCRILKDIYESPKACGLLQRLRSVEFLPPVAGRMHYQEVCLVDLMQVVLGLPSLESISLEGIGGNKQTLRTRDSQRLRKLSITNSKVDSRLLFSALNSIHSLEEFTYTSGGRIVNEDARSPSEMNPLILFHALLRHTATLRYLELDCDHQDSWFRSPDLVDLRSAQRLEFYSMAELPSSTHSSMSDGGWLRNFTALTHLSIGVGFLILFSQGIRSPYSFSRPADVEVVEALPYGLRYLRIRGHRWGEDFNRDTPMRRLVERLPTHHAELKIEGLEEVIPAGGDLVADVHLGLDSHGESWSDYEY